MVEQTSDKKRANQQDWIKEGNSPGEFCWAGGTFQFNEETGKQCIRFIGPSGTGYQIDPDGTLSHIVVGEQRQYCKSGFTLTIDENGDCVIKGHSKVQVGGGAHIEVQGDAGIMVGGDVALAAAGNMGIQASGNMFLGAKGNFNINAEGNMKISAKGTGNIDAGSTLKVGAGSGITVQGTSVALNPAGGSSGYEGGSTIAKSSVTSA